jgi:hypothetical protein
MATPPQFLRLAPAIEVTTYPTESRPHSMLDESKRPTTLLCSSGLQVVTEFRWVGIVIMYEGTC